MAPATVMVSPEMWAASSDARNATVAATSSGSPSRPSGIRLVRVWMCSPGFRPSCCWPIARSTGAWNGVLMIPGAMALTRMVCWARAAAATVVRFTRPAFAAA